MLNVVRLNVCMIGILLKAEDSRETYEQGSNLFMVNVFTKYNIISPELCMR